MQGETLGPYRIDRELGSGGMGKVYAATITGRCPGIEEGTQVALKVVHPHLLEQPGFFKRFMREADLGRSVTHGNVVRTLDCDALSYKGRSVHFLVMEYVDGQHLRELMADLERVPEELCRHIGREVARGLAAIHAAGVIHRDIKPDNVLITPEHEVKVMDLGVARLQEEAVRLSQTGAFVGSLHYAAPESFRGGGAQMDGRSDLHALGLVLYELSCGTNPYLSDSVPETVKKVLQVEPRRLGDANPQVSAFFEEVVHALLAKDPDERFESAEALLAVLEGGEDTPWWHARAASIRAITSRPLRRVRVPRETAVYGREDELARLRAVYDRVKGGEAQVVLVEGEAGIGKSRVVDELIGRLQHEGEDLNFLFGSYLPGGAATASGGFSTAYREQFGEQGSKDYLAETPILVPAFDALLRGEPTPTGCEPLTKQSIQTCFVNATRALATERTTVVLIDDLHFAPEEGRALFAALAMAMSSHRVLLVATHRPGMPEEWTSSVSRLEHAHQVALHRLGPKDLIHLLQDTFRSERLAEQLGAQVALKSDGNPFFVFEIIRGLREGQFISRQDDGTWVSTRVIDDIQIPSSVLDLVNARVADLTEDERALLDVSACWGYEFDPLVVGEVLGMGRIPLLRSLGQIERRHRLVRASGRRFVFDHHQVREALYSSLSELLREEYHFALADALETRSGAAGKEPDDLDGQLCVDLCNHFLRGVEPERSGRYLDPALKYLQGGYLSAQAAALCARALTIPDLLQGERRLEILRRRWKCLELLGDNGAWRAVLDEMQEVAAGTGEPTDAVNADLDLAWHLVQTGDPAEAEPVAERALDGARVAGDRLLEADATMRLGSALRMRGDTQAPREHYEAAIAIAREVGDRAIEMAATGNLASLLQDFDTDRAEELTRACLEHFRAEKNRRNEASLLSNLGNVLRQAGRIEGARECYEESLAIARQIGDRYGACAGLAMLGVVLAEGGRPEEAGEYLEQCHGTAREVARIDARCFTETGLGALDLQFGEIDAAREQFTAALDRAREQGLQAHVAHAISQFADLERASGDHDAAAVRLEEVLESYRKQGNEGGVTGALTSLAALALETGDAERAAALLAEAADTAPETHDPGIATRIACLAALLPGGDGARAAAVFEQHAGRLSHANRMENRFLLWRSTGDRAHLVEAHRLLSERIAHSPEQFRAAMPTSTPLHRDITEAAAAEGL